MKLTYLSRLARGKKTSAIATLIGCLAAIHFSRRAGWLLSLLPVLNGTAAVAGETHEAQTPASTPSAPVESAAAKPPWGRIMVVGASASAGFTESEPLGGPTTPQYRLSRFVDEIGRASCRERV